MLAEVKMYLEMFKYIEVKNIKTVLQVGNKDKIFGSLLRLALDKQLYDVSYYLLLLDGDDINDIPQGLYEKIYTLDTIGKNTFDLSVIPQALDFLDQQQGSALVKLIHKHTLQQVFIMTTDSYLQQRFNWTIVDFQSYEVFYYYFDCEGKSKNIFKLYPTKNVSEISLQIQLNPIPTRLHIGFVVPDKNLTGGLKMFYEQMKYLQKRDHKITVILRGTEEKATPDWVENFKPDHDIVISNAETYLKYLTHCDVIFAGFFSQLGELENCDIPVMYWEQGSESIYGDIYLDYKNESTYRQYLTDMYSKNIYLASDSTFVHDILKAKYNRESYILPNLIDTTFYYPDQASEKNRNQLTILLVGNPHLRFKGFGKALTALRQLWLEGQRFKVKWACQVEPIISSELPFEIEYYINISQSELSQVYRESDILLSCSIYEGCPMPPLEAMASGVAIVATDCGGINQYAKHEYNALISSNRTIEEITNYVRQLLNNDNLRNKLIENGLATARDLNYETGIERLEEILQSIVNAHQLEWKKESLNKKTKILFVIGTLGGGGAEKVLVNLVKYLNKELFDITVLTMIDLGIYIDAIKEVVNYQTIYKTVASSQEELLNIQKRHQFLNTLTPAAFSAEVIDEVYDVEVAFLEDLSTRIVANSPNKYSKKIAWVHTDLMTDNSVATLFNSEEEQKECYEKFDHIVCVSESAKQGFVKRFNEFGKVQVLYNPIDVDDIMKKAKLPLETEISKDKFIIISIGRLVPQKGYERLLRIHKRLMAEGYDYELVILGDGPLKETLNQYIVDHELGDSTRLLGFKDNPYVYLSHSDLFVCSSYVEGYSLVVAEALMLGVPVISTLCAGPDELLEQGNYGMLVENNEQALYEGIKLLLSHVIKFEHYKKQAVIRGKQFNLKQSIIKMAGLFKDSVPLNQQEKLFYHQGKKEVKVTVFTPTYNRGYCLETLYKSLQNQTSHDFEWLVIDDGSTDKTHDLFEQWMQEDNAFVMTYVKVKNGGKHRAINKGTELAKGELFFIVDSDDYLVDNSIERIIYWESTILEKEKFAGVSGNRGFTNEIIIGDTFEGDFIDATSLERDTLNIKGDKAEVFYTRLLKQYKFPEIEGENFITEAVVWFQIAFDGYKIRWFNEITYICEYLEDGLTHHAIEVAMKNPKGYQLANELFQKFYNEEHTVKK
ncbi:MAG TPA: hypothetical protein DCY20_01880 [Firmicutes bacterium]|nr:hypothetical protein [Bacillota bacterium]